VIHPPSFEPPTPNVKIVPSAFTIRDLILAIASRYTPKERKRKNRFRNLDLAVSDEALLRPFLPSLSGNLFCMPHESLRQAAKLKPHPLNDIQPHL
jgi:hypothetical protein